MSNVWVIVVVIVAVIVLVRHIRRDLAGEGCGSCVSRSCCKRACAGIEPCGPAAGGVVPPDQPPVAMKPTAAAAKPDRPEAP